MEYNFWTRSWTDGTGADGDSAYQIWLDAGNVGTEQDFLDSLVGPDGSAGADGEAGADGADGISAYQVWINAGNEGTEQDFLDSLVGPDGAPGADGADGEAGADGANGISAYQVWINAGNAGTEQDFLDSLVGPAGADGQDGSNFTVDATGLLANRGTYDDEAEGFSYLATDDGNIYIKNSNTSGDWSGAIPFKGDKGDTGDPGADGVDGSDGISAYQVWINAGNAGTEQDFLDSLVGADGAPGADGSNGIDGSDGATGDSAYQIWLDAGNAGTEQDFLDSLVGPAGADGQDGTDGIDGGGEDYGLKLSNNAIDSEYDIDISPGAGMDSTHEFRFLLESILTKQINATWVEGSGNGGMANGVALTANTEYDVHGIIDVSSGDVATYKYDAGFDTSHTATNLLGGAAGYTKYRFLGTALTDDNGKICQFIHDGNCMILDSPILDVDVTDQSTVQVNYALSVPTGRRVEAHVNVYAESGGTGVVLGLYLRNPDISDGIPSDTALPFCTLSDQDANAAPDLGGAARVITDDQGRIAVTSSRTDTTLKIATTGWRELQ